MKTANIQHQVPVLKTIQIKCIIMCLCSVLSSSNTGDKRDDDSFPIVFVSIFMK